MIKHQKAVISLNKHERCTFQTQVLCCFVYCRYRGNYISAILKAPPAGRQWICIFNKPSANVKINPCFMLQTCRFVNVNWWIDKKIMHNRMWTSVYLLVRCVWQFVVWRIVSLFIKFILKCVYCILKWFLKDHVTLKTGVMMLKIQLLSQE